MNLCLSLSFTSSLADSASSVSHYLSPDSFSSVPQPSTPASNSASSRATSTAPSRSGTCPLLERTNKATFHGTKDTYQPGETLSYSCNVGFQLQGNSSILECEMNGNWIPRKAKCQSKSRNILNQILLSNICINILATPQHFRVNTHVLVMTH